MQYSCGPSEESPFAPEGLRTISDPTPKMSPPTEPEYLEWVRQSAQRTRGVFAADLGVPEQSSTIPFRVHIEYAHVQELPPRLAAIQANTGFDRRKKQQMVAKQPGTEIPSLGVTSPASYT